MAKETNTYSNLYDNSGIFFYLLPVIFAYRLIIYHYEL